MAIIWSIAAQRDLDRIFEFNARYREDHAVRVDLRLVAATDLIARDPSIGRPIAGLAARERSLTDLQYVIRYRIEADQDVTILQVRHTRENR